MMAMLDQVGRPVLAAGRRLLLLGDFSDTESHLSAGAGALSKPGRVSAAG